MARTLAILTLAAVGAVASYAGQLQIGQTISGVNQGLTTTWVTNTAGAACAGCIQNNSTTGWNNNTIQLREFVNSTPVATVPGQLKDSNYGDGVQPITFDMINGSQGGVSASNMWYALNGTNTLTIPVGVFGVESVWTVMNDVMGVAGANNTNISFYFADTQNGAGATQSDLLTLHLINGQQIEASVQCSPNCGYAEGLNPSSTLAATNVTTGGVTGLGTVNVLTSNLFSSVYTGGSATPYMGTQGTVVLDDQGFQFGGAFSNLYLVDVQLTNPGNGSTASRTAIDALTVLTGETVPTPTPEPGAVSLLVAGCAAFGFIRRRKSS